MKTIALLYTIISPSRCIDSTLLQSQHYTRNVELNVSHRGPGAVRDTAGTRGGADGGQESPRRYGQGGVDLSLGRGHHAAREYGGYTAVSAVWAAGRHQSTVCVGPRCRYRRITVSTRGERENPWMP